MGRHRIEMISALTPERRLKVEARAVELVAEFEVLPALRKHITLTSAR